MQATTFFAFKNANTESNPTGVSPAEKVYVSHKSYSLSKKGQEQVEALAQRCQDIHLDALVYSPLSRAISTVQPIFHKLNTGELPFEKREDLQEINLGDLDGKTAEEVKSLFSECHSGDSIPSDFNDCLIHPWKDSPYTFEPYSEFDHRVRKEVAALHEKFASKRIGLFTHCEFLRNLVLHSIGTKEFFESKFGEDILKRLKITEADPRYSEILSKTLIELGLERSYFKPEDCSCVQVITFDGKQTYIEQTDGVIVRF